MSLIKKKIYSQSHCQVRDYRVAGISLFKKSKGRRIRMYILGIRVSSWPNKKYRRTSVKSHLQLLSDRIKKAKHNILWIDHTLGGGTEVYTHSQFQAALSGSQYIWLRFYPSSGEYSISLPLDPVLQRECYFANLEDVIHLIKQWSPHEIVINNIVGYAEAQKLLVAIANLKFHSTRTPRISFRAHDFHAICPSFNLLDFNDKYCGAPSEKDCKDCLSRVRMGRNETEDKLLRSGATTIADWRATWRSFFQDALDEMVAFSMDTARIFQSVYPVLKQKTVVVPHTVSPLPKVSIPPHRSINIAFVGNMALVCKGRNIVTSLIPIAKDYPGVHLKIIGASAKEHGDIYSTGPYRREELANILFRERIDLVFIPSVWPETFSYLTSEILSTGIPTACFALGAQAERISRYDKGLVIKTMEPRLILEQIIHFIQQNKITP